jgi:lipopolysaccharide transport system ATP-binding protein
MALAIKVENVGKKYRLGTINRDMLYKDIQSWWAKMRGKPDPNAKISFIHQNRLEKGDEFWALRNINLEIEEGEIVGIIGRNGAGKSTLLKILSQITAPTEGKIHVNGRMASLLEVGTGFHPELTGRENVYLNGAIMGMSRKEVSKKFEQIIDFASLEDFIDTPVKRYSSGMYVRLAFSVAAHLEPEILVVDEVLAVGDMAFQQKCVGRIKDLSTKEARTVIFVSHQISLIRNLCKKVYWLEDGYVKKSGDSITIIKNYLESSELETSSHVDLSKNNNRIGNGFIRISKIVCKNLYKKDSLNIQSGQNCSFLIYLTNHSGVKQTSVSISLDFNDSTCGKVLLFNSKMLNSYFDIATDGACFEIIIDKLPLAFGKYNISLYLGQGKSETLDFIDNAITVNVLEGDFFGTGHPGIPSHCKILCPFRIISV